MSGTHARWPLAGVLTGLVILVSGAAPGEAHPAGWGGSMGRASLQEELGLTEDQVQAIRDIFARQRASLRDTVRALREARRALRDLVLQGADEPSVMAKQAEIEALLGRLVAARTQSLRELAGVLTPEQRAQMRDLRPLRRHRGVPLAG
jgi:Spy/CpxP family protein refolding chaperone